MNMGTAMNNGAKHEVDLNMRAAIIHVGADAFVSVLVIIALFIAGNVDGCGFLDPLMGMVGSLVILNWSYTLVVDTTANLLDLTPDPKLVAKLKKRLESDGSIVTDLHVWRLGPGHLGAIMTIAPNEDGRTEAYYNERIKGFRALSHVTIEIGPTVH
jgi:cation diffusion facilitator family transporter